MTTYYMEIEDIHPRLIEALSAEVRNWGDLTPAQRTKWVEEALFNFAEIGHFTIPPAESSTGHVAILADTLVDVFRSRKEIAEMLGVKAKAHGNPLSKYRLPPHDGRIGKIKGWRTSTILGWMDSRRQS